jgi:hypothetical protein
MLFGLFKSKKEEKTTAKMPSLVDLDGNALAVGDWVECLRYEMGKSRLIEEEGKLFYQSERKGEKVSWLRMVDAVTTFQKVRKINQ